MFPRLRRAGPRPAAPRARRLRPGAFGVLLGALARPRAAAPAAARAQRAAHPAGRAPSRSSAARASLRIADASTDRLIQPARFQVSISIRFEYYPHTAPGNSAGTLVATEGGPGYAATESRADYLALFKPLRRERDFVLMDNRGTGGSGAIDCPELQTAEKWTIELIGACGRLAWGQGGPLRHRLRGG